MNTLSRTFGSLALAASCIAVPTVSADSSLYLQPMSPNGGILRASQLWIDPSGENDLDSDAIAWENFTLTANSTVTRVRWWGDALPPLGFTVGFFNQDPNTIAVQPDIFAPGSGPISEEYFETPQVQSVGGGLYQFTVDLATPLTFQADTRYFVSIVGQTPIPFAEWRWAQGAGSNLGTFWWLRGAHMYFHLGDDRAVELFGTPGPSQLMAYDGFGGPPLTDLHGSTGGAGWTGPWLDQTADAVTSVGGLGLHYPGLDTTPGEAITEVGSSPYPMSVYYRSFPQVPAGTNQIFVSFLMRADAGFGAWGGISMGAYPYGMTIGSPLGMYSFGLMTSQGLGDTSTAPLIEGETNLVVVRVSKPAQGGSLTYKLYLNPVIGQAEPSFPLAEYTIAQANGLPTALKLDNGSGFTTDEVRVGTTWASVLPAELGCFGDLNLDGTVDGADLGALLGAWGTPGSADLDENGVTDGADLGSLLGAWGNCP